MRKRFAFTLVELLVVVAIIVAMLAILMPSMGKAVRLAQKAACQSNLRQIGVGVHNHRSDHFGAMISVHKGWRTNQVAAPNVGGFDMRPIWEQYIGNVDALYCPLFTDVFYRERTGPSGSFTQGWDSTNGWAHMGFAYYPSWNYGDNYLGGPQWIDPNDRVAINDKGSRKVMVGDVTLGLPTAPTMGNNYFAHALDNGIAMTDAAPTKMDDANRLYLDGSVDRVVYDDWKLRVTTNTGFRISW